TPLVCRPAKNFSIAAGPDATSWVGGSTFAFGRYKAATAFESPLLNAPSNAASAAETSLLGSPAKDATGATVSTQRANAAAWIKRMKPSLLDLLLISGGHPPRHRSVGRSYDRCVRIFGQGVPFRRYLEWDRRLTLSNNAGKCFASLNVVCVLLRMSDCSTYWNARSP